MGLRQSLCFGIVLLGNDAKVSKQVVDCVVCNGRVQLASSVEACPSSPSDLDTPSRLKRCPAESCNRLRLGGRRNQTALAWQIT